MTSSAAAFSSSKMAATAGKLASVAASTRVRSSSTLKSACSSPTADPTPAAAGTTIRLIPKTLARSTANIGPAPPKPTMTASRGSSPRCTVTTRMAAAMVATAMARTARAASTGPDMPSGAATLVFKAFSAAATSRCTSSARPAGIEIAEHEIGIGDGGLAAAAAVARRPRVGACRARPDPQRPGAVDPGDASAAGADLGEVDHGRLHRQAGSGAHHAEAALAAHLEVMGDRGRAVADQAGLGGRPAHVERQHALEVVAVAELARCDDPRRSARLDREDGPAGGVLGGHDTAGGVHHVDRAAETVAAQHLVQAAANTATSPVRRTRDKQRRHPALVLAQLRPHLRRRSRCMPPAGPPTAPRP